MTEKNYLLGRGELLVSPTDHRGGHSDKAHPYSAEQAVRRLAPQVAAVTRQLDRLPSAACPNDEAVAVFALHPAYIAKSYFPGRLLQSVGLRAVGNRTARIQPEAGAKAADHDEITVELHVAGPRSRFMGLALMLEDGRSPDEQIRYIEAIRSFEAGERLRGLSPDVEEDELEIVLHGGLHSEDVWRSFRRYSKQSGARLLRGDPFVVGSLLVGYVAVHGDQIASLERFAFLRTARRMPRVRAMPHLTAQDEEPRLAVKLPTTTVGRNGLPIAILDGGLPSESTLRPWVDCPEATGTIGLTRKTKHGHSVTSAALFGPIRAEEFVNGPIPLQAPLFQAHHYDVLRVWDPGDVELLGVLGRVLEILRSNRYEFVNVSLGPDLSIEDDEIHPWTAALDECLADGSTLVTIAAGNTGESIEPFSRVQVPGDCVNAVTVGASCGESEDWRVPIYSSKGPGRHPGITKPDLVAHGGDHDDRFFVVDPLDQSTAIGVQGTSLAAPAVLRVAAGVRSRFGESIAPLGIRCLLLHQAHKTDQHNHFDCGWGRSPERIDRLTTCPDGAVSVIYQGELQPGKVVRAAVPVPIEPIPGMGGRSETPNVRNKSASQASPFTDQVTDLGPDLAIGNSQAGLTLTLEEPDAVYHRRPLSSSSPAP